jgi:hypothetical protein
MANQWFGSILALAAAAGTALAQSPPARGPVPTDGVPTAAVVPQAPADGCADGGCAACDSACSHGTARDGVPDNILYARAEYLLWFMKNSHPPTLVGSVPASVVLANGGGNLPPSSITPIAGGSAGLDYGHQSGVRLGAGLWLDRGQCFGLEVEGFWLQNRSFHASFASNGDPVIGPVFNDSTAAGRTTIIFFADPNLRAATMNLDADNRFWSAEVNARSRVCSVFSDRLDAFVGFRYLKFEESLQVNGTTTALPTNPLGSDFSYFDSFNVRNQFYGAQVGLQSDLAWGWWFLNLKGKLGLGDMHESAVLDGATTSSNARLGIAPVTRPGGVLVQPTNAGSFERDRCAFLTEITINTGVQLSNHVRFFIGYNLLFLDRLARAGHQVDQVDVTQIPVLNNPTNANATRPQFTFGDGRFWAYGLNAGMEFRY